MELNRENLGRRIVELARIATAMHLQEALTLASRGGMPADQLSDRLDLDSEVGGAGRRARVRARRSTDGVQRFKDEAIRLKDEANDRPHGAAAYPRAVAPLGGGE